MAQEQETLFPDLVADDEQHDVSNGNLSLAGAGRQPGALAQKRKMLEKLMMGDIQEAYKCLIAGVRSGDPTATKLFWDRVFPRPKSSPLIMDGLPNLERIEDVRAASLKLAGLVSSGVISPDEGASLSQILHNAIAAHSVQTVSSTSTEVSQTSDSRDRLFEKLKMAMERRVTQENPTPGAPEVIQ